MIKPRQNAGQSNRIIVAPVQWNKYVVMIWWLHNKYKMSRTPIHTSFTADDLRAETVSMNQDENYNSGVPPPKELVRNIDDWIFC